MTYGQDMTRLTLAEQREQIRAIVQEELRGKTGVAAGGPYGSFTVNDQGLITWAGVGGSIIAACRKTSAQDAVDSTLTRVNFNSIIYDPHSTITTGSSWVFTAPADGYYTFFAQLSLKVSIDWTDDRLAELALNSPFISSIFQDWKGLPVTAGVGTDGRLWLKGWVMGPMSASDTAYVTVIQDSGADYAINLASCQLIIIQT